MLEQEQQHIELQDNAPCVTISLDIKFIGASKIGDEIIGHTKILKKQNLVFFIL